MYKSEARFLAKQYRQNLSRKQIDFQSNQIFDQLLTSHIYQKNNVDSIMVFLPIYKHNEINTWPFIYHVFKQAKSKLFIPYIDNCQKDAQQTSMKPAALLQGMPLKCNSWGICEPVQPVFIDKYELINLILIPLLAFDKQGFRAGYGKGFYDKFIVQYPNALRIGLSFQPYCTESFSDNHAADLTMHACICPDKIYHF